eukprot:5825947-Amphidinium_carterae.1
MRQADVMWSLLISTPYGCSGSCESPMLGGKETTSVVNGAEVKEYSFTDEQIGMLVAFVVLSIWLFEFWRAWSEFSIAYGVEAPISRRSKLNSESLNYHSNRTHYQPLLLVWTRRNQI